MIMIICDGRKVVIEYSGLIDHRTHCILWVGKLKTKVNRFSIFSCFSLKSVV